MFIFEFVNFNLTPIILSIRLFFIGVLVLFGINLCISYCKIHFMLLQCREKLATLELVSTLFLNDFDNDSASCLNLSIMNFCIFTRNFILSHNVLLTTKVMTNILNLDNFLGISAETDEKVQTISISLTDETCKKTAVEIDGLLEVSISELDRKFYGRLAVFVFVLFSLLLSFYFI